MTNIMKMIVAGACLALLVGCGSSDGIAPVAVADPVAPPADPPPPPPDPPAEIVEGPLGLLLPNEDGVHPTGVMSADVDANTVRVSDSIASITVNDLAFEDDSFQFNITFNLPDGSSVTIDEDDSFNVEDFTKSINETGGEDIGEGIRLRVSNDDGDEVNILIGLGLQPFLGDPEPQELIDEALFIVARVDPFNDTPDYETDTYLVGGAETGTMPTEGDATYHGFTIATIVHHGEVDNDHVRGNVFVRADFEDGLVDIRLSGDNGRYHLSGDDIQIVGSGYGGTELEGFINPSGDGNIAENVIGDLDAAFYGDEPEATAGVFSAAGTDTFTHDVELVGAFGAYIDCGC